MMQMLEKRMCINRPKKRKVGSQKCQLDVGNVFAKLMRASDIAIGRSAFQKD